MEVGKKRLALIGIILIETGIISIWPVGTSYDYSNCDFESIGAISSSDQLAFCRTETQNNLFSSLITLETHSDWAFFYFMFPVYFIFPLLTTWVYVALTKPSVFEVETE